MYHNSGLLFDAIENYDLVQIRELISLGIDINQVNNQNSTPLETCMRNYNPEDERSKNILRYLLSLNPIVVRNSGECEIINLAMWINDPEILRCILNLGGNIAHLPSGCYRCGEMPTVKLLKVLLDFHTVQEIDDLYHGILIRALWNNNKQIINLLLQNKIDVNKHYNEYYSYPIFNIRSLDQLNLLIDNGADITVKNNDHKTLSEHLKGVDDSTFLSDKSELIRFVDEYQVVPTKPVLSTEDCV